MVLYNVKYCLLIFLLISVISALDTTKPHINKHIVIPLNHLGLANRLRIISSAYSISKLSESILFVLWQNNIECPCDFEELFQLSSNDIIVLSVLDPSVFHVQNIAQFAANYVYSGLNQQNITILWSLGVHAPSSHTCQQFIHARHEFYEQLRPALAVQTMIDQVKLDLLSQNVQLTDLVGIHMRAFDSDHDWAVVTPNILLQTMDSSIQADVGGLGVETEQYAIRFDESVSLDSFVTFIDSYLHSVRNNESQSVIVPRILLASNSLAAKDKLIAKYGAQIYTLNLTQDLLFRNSPNASQNIMFAATEFLLLSQCRLIAHTRGSSFAREAANVAMSPVVDISSYVADGSTHTQSSRHYYFYSQHIDMHDCAMPEFIRSRPESIPTNDLTTENGQSSSSSHFPQWEKTCYQESNDRRMCTVLYYVCLCDSVVYDEENISESRKGGSADIQQITRHNISGTYCPVTWSYYHTLSEYSRNSLCIPLLAESNGYSL